MPGLNRGLHCNTYLNVGSPEYDPEPGQCWKCGADRLYYDSHACEDKCDNHECSESPLHYCRDCGKPGADATQLCPKCREDEDPG